MKSCDEWQTVHILRIQALLTWQQGKTLLTYLERRETLFMSHVSQTTIITRTDKVQVQKKREIIQVVLLSFFLHDLWHKCKSREHSRWGGGYKLMAEKKGCLLPGNNPRATF